MARNRKSGGPPIAPPVEHVELSDRNFRRRLIAAVICLAVGIAAIAVAVRGLLKVSDGWITVDGSGAGLSVAEDFTFQYLLGSTELPASAEKKQVTALYTAQAVTAYQLFDAGTCYDGVYNLAYLNAHPNETVTVDAGLYRALEQIAQSGERSVFLGPVYGDYRDLFFCMDDSQTVDFDPYRNADLADYFRQIGAFACNPDSIRLELSDDNQVCLRVSDAYLTFAQEYGFSTYVDLAWMRNAFAADYLADALTSAGFTQGYLLSYDGFLRNLDPANALSFDLMDRSESKVLTAARAENVSLSSRVFLCTYPISDADALSYYTYADGTLRFPYLDVTDGLCKAAAPQIVAYSAVLGCAQTLLRLLPCYTRDSMDADAICGLTEDGVESVYILEREICYTDPELSLANLYTGYTARLLTK